MNRNETGMITTSLDDLINKDNSVRVIDAYVKSLDLQELKEQYFRQKEKLKNDGSLVIFY